MTASRFSARVPSELAENRLARLVASRRAEGRPLVDLTAANPTDAGFDYPPDVLLPLSAPAARRYEPSPLGPAAARAAVAGDYARRDVAVAANRVVMTASTSESYSLLFKLLCDPGDAVLVPAPGYPLFEHLTRLDAIASVPYRLEYHGTWSIDLADLERRIGPGVKALLVVSPANPTGAWLKRDELARLVTLCRANGLALVGDEVFADYPLDPAGGCAASVLEQEDVLTFGLGGVSKSVGLPQVKVGWIAAGGPAPDVQAALDRLEVINDAYLSAGTPALVALPDLLAGGATVRSQIQDRIVRNYGVLRDRAARWPACGVLRAEGGWSAVIRVPATRADEDVALDLLERADVLVHPGHFYDFDREGYLVVSLLTPESTFAGGVDRVLDLIERA